MEEICALDVAIVIFASGSASRICRLHHGLQAAVFRMEYFDKLLGTDPVGQGPQPLSGTAR